MRVLGLCSYPIEAAATRFRMAQFVGPLAERGIELEIKPFLNERQFREFYGGNRSLRKALGMVGPILGRIGELVQARRYDLLFVQREAMMFGPAMFEWVYQKIGNVPMVLDLDDATYVRYISPSHGRSGSLFKFFGKTDNLIRRASAVICGNRFIADHVEEIGTKAVVIPTVVDTDKFRPIEKTNDIPVIGWIGTHSTFPSLEWLVPVFERLAQNHSFVLKVVGSGRRNIEIPGVEVLNYDWSLDREIRDFQSLDIGLYPLRVSDSANDRWLQGKSGFKAIQYMASGVPFVMSPVGVGAELGEPGKTHFNAESQEDWYNSLDRLLSDREKRERMGDSGRRYSLDNFALSTQADKLAQVLRNQT